jgi:hypothetical protein
MAHIEGFKFGEISVDGKAYDSDMVVWWDSKVDYRVKSHEFSLDEFVSLLERKPEAIVVGTGEQENVKVPEEVMQLAEEKNIKLYIDPTAKAIEMFNGLIAQGKKAVLIAHVTC